MTWSIVAVDPATRQVGVAAATCWLGVELVGGIAPGRGVVAAQAATNPKARDEALKAIRAGGRPSEALAAAREASGRDGLSSWDDQQLAVAVLDPEPAVLVHTGTDAVAWCGSRGAQAVSVQGNMLRGAEVVEVSLQAFASEAPRAGRPPDLAERLMRGLEAGAAVGGDHRCPFECPALSAFLAVARADEAPDETPQLYLVAPKAHGLKGALRQSVDPVRWRPGDPKPVETLRTMLDALR